MRVSLPILAVAFSLGAGALAHADPCTDTVVDKVKIIDDPGRVATAAKKLSSVGADVRIWTISSFKEMGVSNLDQYMGKILDQCSSWTSGGKLKSTMIAVLVHPSKYADTTYKVPSELEAGIYYGVQHEGRLKSAWPGIQNSSLKPAISAYKQGEKDAYTRGFIGMMDSLSMTLTPAAAVSTGPTTIVHQDAADYSWIGKAFFGLAVVVVIGVLTLFFLYSRHDKDVGQGFQAAARRTRSNCLNRILELSDPQKRAELEAMITASKPRLSIAEAAELDTAFTEYKRSGDHATSAFNRFDSIDKEDPNKNGLSSEVYRSNEQSYQDIIAEFIEKAEIARSQVTDALEKAHLARATTA